MGRGRHGQKFGEAFDRAEHQGRKQIHSDNVPRAVHNRAMRLPKLSVLTLVLLVACGGAPKPASTAATAPPEGASTKAVEAMQPASDAAALVQQYQLLGERPPGYQGPPGDQASLNAYYKDVFGPWLRPRIAKGRQLDDQVVKLDEAARPEGARAASLYYFGLIDTLRALPVPKSFDDKALGDAYTGSLEDTIAPLKRNARNAAFVALEGYEKLGELHADIVNPLFDRMSATVGGARIRALRTELVIPNEIRNCKGTPGPCILPGNMLAVLNHAMMYWSGPKYDQVMAMGEGSEQPVVMFYVALAQTLSHGPRTLRQYFDAGNPTELELRHVESLVRFAERGGDYAGTALFDAAMLRVLSPPARPAARYFEDAAVMFRKSATLDPSLAERARLAESEAQALARAVPSVVSP